MKVQNINNIPVESMSRAEIDPVSLQGRELTFSSKLTEESNTAYIRHIEELVGQIEKQGQRLAERADMGEMQKYREMINGRSKIIAIIKTVNEKLDTLTKKVLEKEKENIDLLNDIDDIRGLLVDMYL